MRVADLCTRRVICAERSLPLVAAAELMRRHQVGALVIVDGDGERPVAMLTDRDIVVGIVARGVDPGCSIVADAMSASLVACDENEDVLAAIQVMHGRGIRRLPVVDAGGRLVGMLSADDLTGGLADALAALARVMTHGHPVLPRAAEADDATAS